MKKLWQKDTTGLNKIIEAFETKDDLLLDQKLLEFDIKGSIAQAKMLFEIGILNKKELAQLEKGLGEVLRLNEKGKFNLEFGDEDIHTKIENFLTSNYGQVGKKIHTYRSRNDQVLTALRLYSKSQITQVVKEVKSLIKVFDTFKKEYGVLPIPGYTHMQKAMPSTINLWTGAFVASLENDLIVLDAAFKLNDQSPLGSAAGYGLPIKIDREYTAKLLGFSKVSNPVTYPQNSRGKVESVTLASLISVLQTINKFASDVLLFTTSEFNFLIASDEVVTGSSIMPQKENVDLAELLRSKVHIVLGNYIQIVSLSSNLISGYNRDLQDSKKPLMESFEITQDCLKVTQILLQNIKPNKEVLKKAMTQDLYQTEKAYKLVEKGMSFRDAYQKVKEGGDLDEDKN